MARKKDNDYFEAFVDLTDYSCQAANLLNDIINNFDAGKLKDKMDDMHRIEHGGDEARHAMVKRLSKEFITPIEREDIMAMADAIDNVTDTIEDVLMRMYMFNVTGIRDYGLKMTEVIVKCCNALMEAFKEFSNFRKSQSLNGFIIEINHLEEVGDRLYTEATRDLYVNCRDFLEVAAWDQTFHYMEKCCDACEDVANVIENIMMKNS